MVKQGVKRRKLTKLKVAPLSLVFFKQLLASFSSKKISRCPPFSPQSTCLCLLLQATTCSPIHPSASMAFSTTNMAAIPLLLHVQCSFFLAEKGPPSLKKNEKKKKQLSPGSPTKGSTLPLKNEIRHLDYSHSFMPSFTTSLCFSCSFQSPHFHASLTFINERIAFSIQLGWIIKSRSSYRS